MIVVDSSVWIGYLRNAATPQVARLRGLLIQERLLIGDLILLEVLQGARDEEHAAKLAAGLAAFEPVAMVGQEVAVLAARNYQQLRAAGITVRKTVDLIIATFCVLHDHVILHDDRDFNVMQPILGLRML